MVAVGAHRPGPLKQQNKAHKGGKHSGSSQRRAGGEAGRGGAGPAGFLAGPACRGPPDRSLPAGRVSVKAQPRRRLRDLSRVDRRHQALQLRRQRKEAVRAADELGRAGPRRMGNRSRAGCGGSGRRVGSGLCEGEVGSGNGAGAGLDVGVCLWGPSQFGSLRGDQELGQGEERVPGSVQFGASIALLDRPGSG